MEQALGFLAQQVRVNGYAILNERLPPSMVESMLATLALKVKVFKLTTKIIIPRTTITAMMVAMGPALSLRFTLVFPFSLM